MTRDKLINWLTRRTADESQLEAADMLQRDGKELERLRAELAECRAKHMDDLLVLGETAKAERELRAELAECKRDNERLHVAMCQSCVCLNNGETYRGHQIIRAALAEEETR